MVTAVKQKKLNDKCTKPPHWLKLTIALLFTVWLPFTSALLGQQIFTFHDLEKLTLTRALTIKAAELKRRAAKHNLSATRVEHWPEFQASYRYLPDRIDLTDDELNAGNSLILRLSQDIIQVTKTRSARIKNAKAELQAADHATNAALNQALLDFRTRYIDMLQTHQEAESRKRLSRIYHKMLKITKQQYEQGEKLLPDIFEIEKELIKSKGREEFSLARFNSQQQEMADLFNLQTSQIALDTIEYQALRIKKQELQNLAVNNASQARIFLAKSVAENSRAQSAEYRNVHFTPYLGYRYRWHDPGKITGSAEAGIRLAFPLLFPVTHGKRKAQMMATAASWEVAAENARAVARSNVVEAHDRLRLTTHQLMEIEKELEFQRESKRIKNEKLVRLPERVKTDRLRLLRFDVQIEKTRLRKKYLQHEKTLRFYELLYLCGLRWPSELNRTLAHKPGAPTELSHATWVWNTAQTLADDAQQQRLVQFCQTEGLTQVFLSINREIMSSAQSTNILQTTITRLHQNAISVSALIGDPMWIFPSKRNHLIAGLDFIIEYNRRVEVGATFDMLHLDIEPHTLPAWKKEKPELLRRLLETIIQIKVALKSQNTALPIGIDLPTFYHKVDVQALREIISNVSSVTLMAYKRKSLISIQTALSHITPHTTELDKRLVLGLNADDFKTKMALRQFMAQIVTRIDAGEILSGFAIHDYKTYSTLKEK